MWSTHFVLRCGEACAIVSVLSQERVCRLARGAGALSTLPCQPALGPFFACENESEPDANDRCAVECKHRGKVRVNMTQMPSAPSRVNGKRIRITQRRPLSLAERRRAIAARPDHLTIERRQEQARRTVLYLIRVPRDEQAIPSAVRLVCAMVRARGGVMLLSEAMQAAQWQSFESPDALQRRYPIASSLLVWVPMESREAAREAIRRGNPWRDLWHAAGSPVHCPLCGHKKGAAEGA